MIDSLRDAWPTLASVAVVVWGAMWTFVRWTFPPKAREMVRAIVRPQIDELAALIEKKADTADVIAMEKRFEERTRPFLDAIERNTGRTAESVEALNEKIGALGERVSFIEGAWDGTEKRHGRGRRADDHT